MNKLNFVLVIAFVTSLQACTLDISPEVESKLDETGHGQVQNRGAATSNWWDKLPRPEWSKYERENRILFTGDTFYLAPLYTHADGSDFEDYAKSAARLAGEIDIAITSHNVPIVDGSYMIALGSAFEEIKAGTAEYMMTDGYREYQFDGFSVIVKGE